MQAVLPVLLALGRRARANLSQTLSYGDQMVELKCRAVFIILVSFLSISLFSGKVCASHTARKVDTDLTLVIAAKNAVRVRQLLSRGANANAITAGGVFPLMVAADNEDEASVALLLAYGAHVNARDPNGQTALHHAALYGLSPADENDFQSQGDVSQRCAIVSVMRLLVTGGANVNVVDRAGMTPLMLVAAYAQSPGCVRLLLAHGANAAPKTKNGWSALRWALWGAEKGVDHTANAEFIVLLKNEQEKRRHRV